MVASSARLLVLPVGGANFALSLKVMSENKNKEVQTSFHRRKWSICHPHERPYMEFSLSKGAISYRNCLPLQGLPRRTIDGLCAWRMVIAWAVVTTRASSRTLVPRIEPKSEHQSMKNGGPKSHRGGDCRAAHDMSLVNYGAQE